MSATVPAILGGSLSGSMYTLGTSTAANQVIAVNAGNTAWSLLTLGTAATFASSSFAQVANNLSDVANVATARANLGAASLAGGNAFSGNQAITPASNGTSTLRVNIADSTPAIQIGSYPGFTSLSAVWLGNLTPSGTNYLLLSSGAETYINSPSGGTITFRVGNSTKATLGNSLLVETAATFLGPVTIGVYTVATLPTAGTAGRTAFASNGRKTGQVAAAGTGVLVYDDGTAWRACDTGATVAA